jgi:alkylation response protein AidB-like acyl-CoA dehydrogenase
MVLGTAMQTYGDKLSDQQEILSYIADIVCETYVSESAVLRANQAAAAGGRDAALHESAARVFVNDAAQRLENAAKSALAGMAEGDTLRTLLTALRRVLKLTPANTIALRRTLADAAIQKGGYIL